MLELPARASAQEDACTPLPLTAAQHGIWLGQQLDKTSPAYWTAEAVELLGALNHSAFVAAIRLAIAESDALHMRFDVINDEPCQVLPTTPELTAPQIDVSCIEFAHAHDDKAFDTALCWMQHQITDAPDLNKTLYTTALLTLGVNRHVWFLKAHHIILDGYGYALLARRVASWYAYIAHNAPMPRRNKANFANVIDEDLCYQKAASCESDRQFWLQTQASAIAPAIADAAPLSFQVLHARGFAPHGAFSAWRNAAQRCNTDWTAWLAAVVAIWIYRWSGNTDITLGLPVMGRMGSVAATVPCMCMNIVPLRIELAPPMSLCTLAQQISDTLKRIRPHQRYRYEKLKHDLDIDGRRRKLFGPVLNIMPFDRPVNFADLQANTHTISAGPVEDIAINIAPRGVDVALGLDANANAYTPQRLTELRDSLLALLQRASAHDHSVQQLAATLSPPAQHAPENEREHEPLHQPPEQVTEKLLAQLQDTPHNIATVQTDGSALSYRELVQRALTIAYTLQQHRVQHGDRVVVLLPRSNDAIVAMLGILYCGAVYVPLDANGPTKRNEVIIAATRPAAIISKPDLIRGITTGEAVVIIHAVTAPPLHTIAIATPVHSDPAYIIYTSGSTGVPNGVEISHGALAHYVAAATQRYQIDRNDRVLQFSPLHFDASMEEILLCLCNGATLVLRDEPMLVSLPAFTRRCEELQISILGLPTAFWHELVYALDNEQIEIPRSVRCVIIGGEAASASHVQKWLNHVRDDVVLINTYGPTETTIVCTSARLAATHSQQYTLLAQYSDAVPIGTPLPGLECFIVDERLQPLADGERGELIVLGPQLATHYVDNDALTKKRFVSLPWRTTDIRAYRTGDIAIRAADGNLYFCGRVDNEMKISGQRIALEQIEATLLLHEHIIESCVLATGQPGNHRLIAFVAGTTQIDEAELLNWLGQRLLAAAVPAQLIVGHNLPKNSRGKIDRNALLAQWQSQSAAQPDSRELTPLQALIAQQWCQVLGLPHVALHNDFFSLGGRSLQAIAVINRLSAALGCELAVTQLFEHSTVAALASQLQTRATDASIRTTGNATNDDLFAPLITLQRGAGPTVFCIYPADGLAWCYLGLARELRDCTIYGLQAPGLSDVQPADFSTAVADSVARIRAVQSHGPYHLLGWSSGGGIAHAVAAALESNGYDVPFLVLLDAYPASCWHHSAEPTRRDAILMALDDVADAVDALGNPRNEATLRQYLVAEGATLAGVEAAQIDRMLDNTLHNMRIYRAATHPRFHGDVLFFRATQQGNPVLRWQAWQTFVAGDIRVTDIDCTHFNLYQPPHIGHIAQQLAKHLLPIAAAIATE